MQTLSSTESEFVALQDASTIVVWMMRGYPFFAVLMFDFSKLCVSNFIF